MRTKHTKTCPICEKTFETEHVRQVCDTDRCTYLRLKLAGAPAQSMSRADGIEYYGGLYDSPVRGIVRPKYKALAIAIHDLCVEYDSREFVYSELPPHIKDMYGAAALRGLANSKTPVIQRTNRLVRIRRNGKPLFVWVFIGEIKSWG